MKLKKEGQVIRVRLLDGQCGEVIGTSESLIGVLLDSGEYVDAPENTIKIRRKRARAIEKT